MKIFTRRGDRGETDLLGGPRVRKDHVRVEAFGAVDELNASLGVAASASTQEDIGALLEGIQRTLFDLGASLASPDAVRREKAQLPIVRDEDVVELESEIERLEQELDPLERFILPGGSAAAAAFHAARTVCRRAERRVVALDSETALDGTSLRYLNRLSDLLFVIARVENRRADVADIEWQGRRR